MAWPHPKNDAFRERRGKVSCHPGEIRQLCLEMSGQGLKAAHWRKKKKKKEAVILCQQAAELCVYRLNRRSVSGAGPCACQLVTLGRASRLVSPLLCNAGTRWPWVGLEHVLPFKRMRRHRGDFVFFSIVLFVQSERRLF